MGLFKRAQRGPIVGIDAGQLKSLALIVAAPSIEFCAMVGESKQMALEKGFESGTSSLHLSFGVFELSLSGQYIGKAPIHLRVADRLYWSEQRFRLAEVSFRRANFGQMHSRFRVHWQDGNCLSIPSGSKGRIRLRG